MAGLVGGDSDSSALTQESGDEGEAPNARESVVTAISGGTDAEEEDEMQEEPAGPSTSSKTLRKHQPTRNEPTKLQKTTKPRTAAATAASSAARTVKKRKK